MQLKLQIGTYRMTLVALRRLLLTALVLSVAWACASPNTPPAGQSSEQVLAEGNPPLTQAMVDHEIAVWEVFFEIKINREQHDALQRAIVEEWKRGDKEVIDGMPTWLKLYGKESEILSARQANQSAVVEQARKKPNDPEIRVILEIYDAAHPERKDFMRTHGMGDLVGEWKRVDALLASRVGTTHTYVGQSMTDTLILNIFSDGHFKHQWSHSQCRGLSECCQMYGTNVDGGVSAQGSNVVLRASSGAALMKDACTPSLNFFKSMNPDPANLVWSVTQPNANSTRLCFSDRPFGFNFDHKAPAEPVCYEKQH